VPRGFCRQEPAGSARAPSREIPRDRHQSLAQQAVDLRDLEFVALAARRRGNGDGLFIKPRHLRLLEPAVPDLDEGATAADRCSLLHGEADGTAGGAETTRTKRKRGLPVAPEIELGR